MAKDSDTLDISEIREIEEIVELLNDGGEEALLNAIVAAAPQLLDQPNNSGVSPAKEPERPKFIPPYPPRIKDSEGQKALFAARVRTEAETNKLEGTTGPDHAIQAALRRADNVEAEASKPMLPDHYRVGAGGVLVPDGSPNRPPAPWRDTVATPSLITAEAAQSHLELANECGVLSQTLDLCDTIGAVDSIERIIAANIALANRVAMQSGKFASESFDRANGAIEQKFRETCSVQGQRATNAMARAMATVAELALALQKKRSGGKQNITVTHIQNTQVNEGGKAIVTSGTVATPGDGLPKNGGQG